LKLKSTHQLLAYAYDVTILDGSVHTIKKHRILVVASKENGLEVNADKSKYIVMSRDQNTGPSINIMIDNSSFERAEQFRYLGTTLTDLNSIQEEIKSRLRSGNACYHSLQNLFFSSLLSRSMKFKIYRIIILPVLYGCDTWSLILREKFRLRVLENRMLRRIFGQDNRGEEKTT
jgi:hypothetical protein